MKIDFGEESIECRRESTFKYNEVHDEDELGEFVECIRLASRSNAFYVTRT